MIRVWSPDLPYLSCHAVLFWNTIRRSRSGEDENWSTKCCIQFARKNICSRYELLMREDKGEKIAR